MTILFHPSFDGGYYMNCGKGADILGKKVVGMAGLLDHLSLHNGLSGRFASDGERAAAYLADVEKCVGGSWIEGPFRNDKLGVAKRLLEWRDQLIFAGWTPDQCGTAQTPKLQLLSHIEESWKARMKGSSDRWLELARLSSAQTILGSGDTITCTCAKEQLPLLVQKVLEACHTAFPNKLKEKENVHIPEDLDIKVLHYNDMLDAYRFVAAQEGIDSAIINRDNVSLNHILLAWGKPQLDATIQDSNPLSLQLFKLALSVFSRPLNIQNLLSYFLLPLGPIPKRLRTALANVLVSDGGFGEIDWNDENLTEEKARRLKDAGLSSNWEKAIWEFVEDEEGQSKLTREKRDAKRYFLLPITDHTLSPDGGLPVPRLMDYIGAINQWAAKIAYSEIKKENEEHEEEELSEALKSQLSTVISYFKQLQETLKGRDSITYHELEKCVNTIYQPTTIVQNRAQVGSFKVIYSYQQLVDVPESILWLDCCGADTLSDRYDFLNAQEREWLNKQPGICIPQLQDLLDLNRKEMILTLSKIKGGITLVTSDYHHNQKMTEHPLVAELKMQRGDKLVVTEGNTDLPRSSSMPVRKVEPKLDYQLGKIEYAGRSESNTSIDTLINYPFDYTVHYVARLGEPSKKELASLSTTTGLVAHQFIQKLVDAVKELPEKKRLEGISELIDKEYERRLDEALQTTGLLLLLKENEVEYNNLRFLLKRSVKKLVKILEYKHLIPVACELKHSLPVFSDGSDFNARIDFELKDGAGNAVIFDFKWSYASYYGDKIKEGTAIQLELYRKELEAEGKTVAAVGYYLLPKCVFDTSDFDTFKDAEDGRILIRHIDPPAGNNRFRILENSVFERKGEILAGDIEEGEEMDILGLTYSQALMDGKEMLWPGKPYKKSPTKANPDPPVERVDKESKKVFVDKIDTRFSKKKAEHQDKAPANEIPTTYPLLKGRLK